MIAFGCNICGERSVVPRSKLGRETPSCRVCGSSVRYRAIVHALSTGLFGASVPLPDFPLRLELQGVGMSDWEPLAERLRAKLGYRNTYYHQEPRLDLTAVPPRLLGSLDFVVCSDVLEHVAPPVERAAASCLELLKPGGCLVLTVPYSLADETAEHFPELLEYELLDFKGETILVNRTAAGGWQVFDAPVLHGGTGETLEMRLFSRPSLLRLLDETGFADVVALEEDVEEFGVFWSSPDSPPVSAPILARRPGDAGNVRP